MNKIFDEQNFNYSNFEIVITLYSVINSRMFLNNFKWLISTRNSSSSFLILECSNGKTYSGVIYWNGILKTCKQFSFGKTKNEKPTYVYVRIFKRFYDQFFERCLSETVVIFDLLNTTAVVHKSSNVKNKFFFSKKQLKRWHFSFTISSSSSFYSLFWKHC